jgi:GNAT superfamily N-acetyltransferase
MEQSKLVIRSARESDVALILSFIKGLADYERLPHEVMATEEMLRESLFGERPAAEVIIGFVDLLPVSFALYFFNMSTFLGKRGLYLEDLFVVPEARGRGIGRAMLVRLAQIAKEHNCGRMEWAVLDWNEPAINFYTKLGAKPMEDWSTFRLTGDALEKLSTEN